MHIYHCTLQSYEQKLEELETALVKQLQADTAVEKLEEQRKVTLYRYIVLFLILNLSSPYTLNWQEFMIKVKELEEVLSQKQTEVVRSSISEFT